MSSYLGLPAQSARARSAKVYADELDLAFDRLLADGPLLVSCVPSPSDDEAAFARLLELLEHDGRARSRTIAGQRLPSGRYRVEREFTAIEPEPVEEEPEEKPDVPETGDAGAALATRRVGSGGLVMSEHGESRWMPGVGEPTLTPRRYV